MNDRPMNAPHGVLQRAFACVERVHRESAPDVLDDFDEIRLHHAESIVVNALAIHDLAQ